MTAFIGSIRSGNFLTRERVRLWALAVLAASAVGLLFLAVTSDGLNDIFDRPLGTDFSNVYAAGTYVLDGQAAAPFDWPMQHAREQALFGANTPFYGWHYPPYFLFVAGALALMPYAMSLAVWQFATLALYLGAIRSIIRSIAPHVVHDSMWLLLALAFPAVFVNVGHGHNGFLTAALLGYGLVALDARPVLAGVLFGLIAYKPQFAVLIPFVLAATGRWRAFTAAAGTVAAMSLATLAAFGPDVWHAFFDSAHLTRIEVLEHGSTGWHKIQSVFSMVRMWGGSIPLAYTMQTIVAFALLAALLWLWRSAAAFPLKAGALCMAAIMVTPYSLDYDFVVLAPAIAFVAVDGMVRGFSAWQKTTLGFLWLMPLIGRTVAQLFLVPLGAPAVLLMLVLVLVRAMTDVGIDPRWKAAPDATK